jgi:hypothetical protein
MSEGGRDYAVGYGKPPAHSRFVKGRSGNPSGRPRGHSLAALLRTVLDETVTIEIGGRRRRLSKGEAILARLVDGAVAAEPRSTRLFLQLASRLEAGGALRDPNENMGRARADDIRGRLLQRIAQLARGNEQSSTDQNDENSRALARLAEAGEAAGARPAAAAAGAAPQDMP